MCNQAGVEFARRVLTKEWVAGRRVLEVGSITRDLATGQTLLGRESEDTIRAAVARWHPAEYIGVDIEPGPGVDEVCDVYALAERFGPKAFDIVIAAELVEHLRDWRAAVRQMTAVLRPRGQLLITTRSWGFPFHRAPFDYWRYEPSDMELIFPGCHIEPDPLSPGVFVLAGDALGELGTVNLRSILTGRRQHDASRWNELLYRVRRPRLLAGLLPEPVKARLRGFLPPARY